MQQIYSRTPMPKLLCNFIEITLRHRCSPVNLLHIFRTLFSKDTSGELLLVPALLRPIFLSYKSQSLYWHSKLLFLFCIISYLFNEKQPPQVFYKKVLLKILQNSQKNTCPRLSFLKKRPWHRCFPVNFAKFLRTPFLQNTSGRLRLFNEHFCSKRQQQKVKDHSLFLSPHPKRSWALFTKRSLKITLLYECFLTFFELKMVPNRAKRLIWIV